jgi:hypothetical protein
VTRQELNREILKLLTEANERMPDQRFGQLLINCGITLQEKRIDNRVVHLVPYYVESEETFKQLVNNEVLKAVRTMTKSLNDVLEGKEE